MEVPLGMTNQSDFIRAALAKGIKITSRYRGVSLYKNNGTIAWRGSFSYWDKNGNAGKGKQIVKTTVGFPLTAQGEKSAHEAYLRLLTAVAEVKPTKGYKHLLKKPIT